jgi:hypothetical protein
MIRRFVSSSFAASRTGRLVAFSLVFACMLGVPSPAQAQFTQEVITSCTPCAPESVHATDVDGDGDTDILSASADDNTIAWLENDGSQNFTVHTITTSAGGANGVYAADVDGDNDTDILTASGGDDRID